MVPPNTFSAKRRKRVLLIDDDPSIAEWTREVLEAEGHDARCALIGARGLELFRQWGPDAVVVNLTLPDVDGIELARRLKEADPWPEIIATGRDSSIFRMSARVSRPLVPGILMSSTTISGGSRLIWARPSGPDAAPLNS